MEGVAFCILHGNKEINVSCMAAQKFLLDQDTYDSQAVSKESSEKQEQEEEEEEKEEEDEREKEVEEEEKGGGGGAGCILRFSAIPLH